MQQTTGAWLEALILAHLDELTDELVQVAQRDLPAYAGLPGEEITARFVWIYRGTALALGQGDLAPRNAERDAGVARRMRGSATAADMMHLTGVIEGALQRLIQAASADQPARQAEALRQMRAMQNNMRLAFSNLNIRLLTDPASIPES